MTQQRKPYLRQAAEVRRQKLMEATVRCLVTHGVADTTVRRIAEEADLSLGMIRHHFQSKDSLLAATYQYLSQLLHQQAEKAIAAAGDQPLAQLHAFITAGLRPPILKKNYIRARFLFWGLSHTHAEVRAVHDRIYATFHLRLRSLLKAVGVEEAELDRRTLLIVSLLKGIWLEWSLNPRKTDPASIIDQIMPLVGRELQPAG